MEMMAQYHSLILAPDQLGSVGAIWLIAMAAILVFDLKSWLKPPAPTGDVNDPVNR
jgi:hypothetical protein